PSEERVIVKGSGLQCRCHRARTDGTPGASVSPGGADRMDVLDIIEADHDAIESLIDMLEAVADSSSDRDIARAGELGGELATELQLHLHSEEHVVYRACQHADPALRDHALAGAHPHLLID